MKPWFRAMLEDGGVPTQERDIIMGTGLHVSNVDTTNLEGNDLVVELAKLIGAETDGLSYDAIQREYGPQVEERIIAERAPDGSLNLTPKKVQVYRSMEERKAFYRKMKEVTRRRLAVQSEAYAQGYHLGDNVSEMELEDAAAEAGNSWTQWDNQLNYTKAYRKPLKFRMSIGPNELRVLVEAASASESSLVSLLKHVEPLVNKAVFRFAKKYDEDLIQEGYLGVIRAVKAFDPKKAGNVEQFVAKYITNAVGDAMVGDTMELNGVGAAVVEKQIKLKRLYDALEQKLARAPTDEELIRVTAKTSLGILTRSQIGELLSMRRPLSTDYLLTDDDGDSITLMEKLSESDVTPVPSTPADMQDAELRDAEIAQVTEVLGGGDRAARDALRLIGFFKGEGNLSNADAAKLQRKIKMKEVK